jgi:DNA-binding NarL/FixJ family response regulator
LQKENFRRAEFRETVNQALKYATVVDTTAGGDKPAPAVTENAKSKPTGSMITSQALVIEDDAGWQGLLTELLNDSGYQVHVSSSYGEAQGLLKREQFQLAIADISLASSLEPDQNLDGYRLLNSTRQAKIPTIVVSGYADPDLIDRAYAEHQIFACFEKQAFERKAFVQTIQQVREQTQPAHNLTQREIEVLALLAKGLGNKEIAVQLHISTNTVKRHLKSIYAKLEVNTRAAASAYAIRLGLGRG